MALSDWNYDSHGPEILVDVGTVGLQRGNNYPIITAEFGDGYYKSAAVGSIDGVRAWSCTWVTKKDIFSNPHMVIPIYDSGKIVEGPNAGVMLSFSLDVLTGAVTTNATYEDMQPRMIYLQRFFQRRMADGMPFVFVDPGEYGPYLNISDPYDYANSTKWLARFKTPGLSFRQSGNNKTWSYSAEIVAVRPGYY